MNITVLGTGIMGSGICTVLASKGFDVTAWNRTAARASALAENAALPHLHAEADITRAVADADVIMVVAFDAASVLDVMSRAIPAAPAHAIWMQMATIGAAGAQQVRTLAAEYHLHAVETMMMGSKDQAASARLILIGGGAAEYFAALEPVTAAIAQKTVVAGDAIGDGTAVKLACNAWIAGITVTAAQSVQLLRHEGVDPQLFLDVIAGGTSDSPYAHMKGGKAISGDYSSQFEISALAKDMSLMREVMVATSMRSDFLDKLIELYGQASNAGHDHDDISAVSESFA
jgi:3-hydroxyisobutyrate dehydrogenase